MKCYMVDGTGLDGIQLEQRPDAGDPGPGEVAVDVQAVSLNYRDLMVADGRYGGQQDPPIIACSDMAGRVAGIGPGVTAFQENDRVLNAPFRNWPAGNLCDDWIRTFVGGNGVDGILAERIIYPAASLVKVPAHLSFAEGSTLTIAGLTAWSAVVTHGKTRPGEWVLLQGTGGVSIFGAQIAKALGAQTILSTSSEAKGEKMKQQLGVDVVIDYREPEWPKQVIEITGGRGADVIVEVVGGQSLPQALQCCAFGARVAQVGVLGGPESTINVRHLLARQVTLRGIFMESAQELQAFARAVEGNQMRPVIDRQFLFEEARAAYDHLQSQQHIGKVVINVGKQSDH